MSTETDYIEGEIVPGTALEIPSQGSAALAPSDPFSLLALALQNPHVAQNVDVIERLVALQERATERNARAAFFEAKAAFQAECPEIRKSRKADIATKSGARFGYTYAPLEEITRTILPVLAKHGLSFTWDVAEGSAKVLAVSCILRHIEGHEDRATFPVPVETGGRMSDAQAMGAALTYGRRQSLIAVLGLTTADEDTDAAHRAEPKTARTITREQLADLEALIDEVGADRGKFLAWLDVPDLTQLTATDLPKAIKALEKKRGDQ